LKAGRPKKRARAIDVVVAALAVVAVETGAGARAADTIVAATEVVIVVGDGTKRQIV
jgi:hypothetical protein